MMRLFDSALKWVLLPAVCLHVATADQLRLKSGDRLMGTLQQMNADAVVIKTAFADVLRVERKQVANIRTDEPVTVVLKSGDYITARLLSGEDDMLRLEIADAKYNELVPLSAVEAIYHGDPLDTLISFSGRLSMGLSRTSGNSENENYTILGQMETRTPENRFTLQGEFRRQRAEGIETGQRALGFFKYDHFLTEKLYLFNSATFEHDEFADLNLRTALAGGLGYQVFETQQRVLSFEAGAAFVNEDFELAEDDAFPSARWAANYEQAIYGIDKIRFFHFQEGLVAFEEAREINVRTRTGFEFDLLNAFVATLQANLDWDNDPAPGSTSVDKEYLFTLGYQW